MDEVDLQRCRVDDSACVIFSIIVSLKRRPVVSNCVIKWFFLCSFADVASMDHSHHHMTTPSGNHDHHQPNTGGHESHGGMVRVSSSSAACSLKVISHPKSFACCLGDDLLRWLPERGAAVQRPGHQLSWRWVRPDWFHVSLFHL